jgi:drug/metabolite transporter (DMT)-like permease
MAVAVLGVSTSAPLIAATAAPVLAIAFWRNVLAGVVTTPFALFGGALRVPRRYWLGAVFGGLALAAHFATWMPSLRFTSVASSTALVATQPVWAAIIARVRGQEVTRWAWVGIGIAFSGAVVLTGVDFSFSRRALFGDLLALVGAALAAVYVTIGAHARLTLTTSQYTSGCYLTASVPLLVICLIAGLHVSGYSAHTWLQIAALTVFAQLLGHTLFNVVLRSTSPTVVSLAILFELPGAAIIAAIFLHQHPPVEVWPAIALILAGLVVVIATRRVEYEPEAPQS